MTLSRCWHGLLALIVLLSLVVQIVLLMQGGTDVNTTSTTPVVGLGARLVRLFSFFTIQSNILVLVSAVGLTIDPQRDGRLWRVLRLDALLGIIITGIVFSTVLVHQVQHSGISTWVNFGFHYFAPVWTLAGWLIFGPRPRIDAWTVAWAFAWPVLWILYTFIRGALTGWYPYPFLNADVLGHAIALRNTCGVLALALILCGVLSLLDRRLPVMRR